jgi:UDP-N-acetylmuramoylalanine--D-glutamate ligase
MENYAWAKAALVDYQQAGDWAVLNRDDAYSSAFRERTRAQVVQFSLEGAVNEGGYLDGEWLKVRLGGEEVTLCARSEVRLRGHHNLANVLAAACAARLAGAGWDAIRHTATEFEGVPHRLEIVRHHNGVTYINDSISTAPERAIAAMRAFHEPLILLAGGRDKHLPWDTWAGWVRRRVRTVVAFGEAVPVIEAALTGAGWPPEGLRRCATLEEAVAEAAALAEPGDVVLLSPGGTSFDAFADFEARGEAFRRYVEQVGEDSRA